MMSRLEIWFQERSNRSQKVDKAYLTPRVLIGGAAAVTVAGFPLPTKHNRERIHMAQIRVADYQVKQHTQ